MKINRFGRLAKFQRIAGCMGGSDAGDAARKLAEQREKAIATQMTLLNNAFSGYNDSFYQGRADAYTKAAMPQLAAQYGAARKSLGFKLANQGLYKSGAGMQLGDSLANELATQKQNVADSATASANALRTQVENYKTQLASMIQSSDSPAATAQSVLSGASQFSTPSAFAPLGNLFGNWASTYLTSNLASGNGTGYTTTYASPTYATGRSYSVNNA